MTDYVRPKQYAGNDPTRKRRQAVLVDAAGKINRYLNEIAANLETDGTIVLIPTIADATGVPLSLVQELAGLNSGITVTSKKN